jgi:hypothetical protein
VFVPHSFLFTLCSLSLSLSPALPSCPSHATLVDPLCIIAPHILRPHEMTSICQSSPISRRFRHFSSPLSS